MAQNQNSSFLNQFSSAIGDKTINNGQFLSLHTHFNQNYVHGNDLLSFDHSLSNRTANIIGFQHQYGHIFQNSHLDMTGFSQQRFCQSITELRQTLIASSRLQSADYGGYRMQNQRALPRNNIQFPRVVRNTQILSPSSIMGRLLSEGNTTFRHKRDSNFGNPRLLALKQPNRPSTQNMSFSSNVHHYQNNSFIRQTPTTIDLEKDIDRKTDLGLALHPPPRASQAQGQNLSLAPNPSPNLNPTFELHDIKSHRNFNVGQSSRNPISISNASNDQRTYQTNNNDTNEAVDQFDGITRSLPSRIPGTYICPKCKAVIFSSQKFASHVKSHYRSESPAERRRRLAAKIKKKIKKNNKFRLAHSRDGLTVVPVNN